jgi:hypothetical protein
MRNRLVFINCPFSDDYTQFYWALIYTVKRCGFVPRCAREADDSGANRLDKILNIISDCDLGVHDISKAGLDPVTNLARFNMPFELGLFLGAAKLGDEMQNRKRCIIFDEDAYRYRSFISDIAGHDIHAHSNDVWSLTSGLCNWLRQLKLSNPVPGGEIVAAECSVFLHSLPTMAGARQLALKDLQFDDLTLLVDEFISTHLGGPDSKGAV